MSKIKLTGSNSGYVEIDSAADAGNLTLQLPTSGTKLLSDAGNVFTGITTTGELDVNGKIDVSTDIVLGRNLKVTGITTLSNDVILKGGSYDVLWDSSDNALEFGTNAKATFGGAMQLYHDGSNSLIQDSGTGHVQIRSGTFTVGNAGLTKTSAIFNSGSGQQLNFNNNQKFITTNTGVVVTGICTATSFSGDGSSLTNLSTPLSFRNKIINGSMMVFQRGVGTNDYSAGHDGYYAGIADRWAIRAHASMGTQTYSQNINSPNNFGNSQRIYTTGADGGNAGKYYVYDTKLEGQDLQDFEKGTSTAKPFTLSFYVKCNINRVFTCELRDLDNGRACVQQYTTTNSNWNRYELTFPADTTGKFDNDKNASLWVRFWLSAGFNFKSGTSQTTWGSVSDANICPGQTGDLGGRVGDYWYVTGVQLEVGDTATPFEQRSFMNELERCRRYYQVILDRSIDSGDDSGLGGTVYTSNGGVYVPIRFCPPMRTKPTVESSSNSNGFRTRHGDLVNFTSFTGFNTVSRLGGTLITSTAGNKVVGDYYWIETDQGAAKLAVLAEL